MQQEAAPFLCSKDVADPLSDWEGAGLATVERTAWVESGIADPELAAMCRRSGIVPADLSMPLKGTSNLQRSALQRLQRGQSVEAVSRMIRQQLPGWGDVEGRDVDTDLPLDEMDQRDRDCRFGRILGFLWDRLEEGLPKPLAIFLGGAPKAYIYVHWVEDRQCLTFVKPNAVPPPASFLCPGHPGPEPVMARAGRSRATLAIPTCKLGLLEGVREALYAAPEADYDCTNIGYANLTTARSLALVKPMEQARTAKRSTSRTMPPLSHWQGFPVPAACRTVTTAVLGAIDEQVTMSVNAIQQVAQATRCEAHPDADLAPLLTNTELITPIGDARGCPRSRGF
jgi:hypothetical protein